jgi:glycolate oxidase iron-sulfur subunit
MSCNHCGVCLESCPTYTLWGTEADSPRGRITLIEDALSPGGGVSAALATHVDSCLGCMACMSVCPEDVDFWSMLDDARTQIKERVDRPVKQDLRRRAVLSALPHVGRARRALPGGSIPHYTPAQEPMRGRLGLLLGCTERVTHSEIHRATIAVLSAEGYEVIAPQLPDCCGSIDLHGGDRARAKHHAEATIRAFEGVGGVDKVITSAGACGFALKDYGRLLGTAEARAFSAVALDVNELLTAAPLRSHLGPLGVTAVLHEACQLTHAQRLPGVVRKLLFQIPSLELLELDPEAGACCGAPGIYRFTEAEASTALGARQAQAVAGTRASVAGRRPTVVVTADHACGAQLARHLRELVGAPQVRHPIELLAESIEAGRR